jgi:signal transduction histidine kinase/GAF domain-containing protein
MEVSVSTVHNRKNSPDTLDESAIVERVARIVASVRGTKPDYTRLAAELEQAIPFDVFGIVLLRHDRQAVRVVVCSRTLVYPQGMGEMPRMGSEINGRAAHWHTSYHQHPLEDSMLYQMLRKPKLVIRNYPEGVNGLPNECGDALSGFPQLRSILIAPLKVEERVLGTLELGGVEMGLYAPKKLQRLVQAVAPVIATAIEGAQSGGNVKIQDRQRQALKNVSTALTQNVVDRDAILRQIVVGIAQSLSVSSAIVTMEADGHMHLAAQEGLPAAVLAQLLYDCYPVHGGCIIGSTFITRQPSSSLDIAHDKRFPASAVFFSKLGASSIYCYPLVSGAVIYGVLLICSPDTGGFTPLKVDILSLFANQATIAFHNSLLLDTLRQRRNFQEIIERLERTAEKEKLIEPTPAELLALLQQAQSEAQRLFGVSFSSLLGLVSRYLLTQSERTVMEMSFTNGVAGEQSVVGGDYVGEIQKLVDVPTALNDTLSRLARRTEGALRRAGMLSELSELLIQLTESTGGVKDAWFVTDLDGNFVYMNPAAESFSGLTMSRVEDNQSLTLERVFAELFPRMRNAEVVRQYVRNVASGETYQQVLRCVLAEQPLAEEQTGQGVIEREAGHCEHMQGVSTHAPNARRRRLLRQQENPTDRYYHLMCYPLCDRQGQQVGRALRVSDVTEQVREELHRSALLSVVSHDLRTPLTTIKTAVTGLLQEGIEWDAQDRQAILADIDAETDHLTVLVNDLVDLSRIEMGALVLEKEWCDLIEVASSAVERTRRSRLECAVRLYAQRPLPPIFVDFGQIERVLVGLIENATRSSPPQSTVSLILDLVTDEVLARAPMKRQFAVEHKAALSQWVRVRVVDQGEGIPQSAWEEVFQRFYSSHADGNELRLAICKGIVEAHQGYIWVEAAPTEISIEGKVIALEQAQGAGTCFVLVLPAHTYRSLEADEDTVMRRSTRETARAEEE